MRSLFNFIVGTVIIFLMSDMSPTPEPEEEYFVLKYYEMEAHFPVIKKKNIIKKELPYSMPGNPVYAYYDTLNNYTIFPYYRNPNEIYKTRYNISNLELSMFVETIHFHCEAAQRNISRFKRLELYLKRDFRNEQSVMLYLEHDYECRIYEEETPMTRLRIINFFDDSRSYVIEISKPVGSDTIEDEINWAKSFLDTCMDIDKSY